MDDSLIKLAAEHAGIPPTLELLRKTAHFIDVLLEANQSVNLTAITEPFAVATRHLQDCWTPARFIAEGASVIDVGTGAGFPGIPLFIARPDLNMTLLDAAAKRVRFLESVVRQLFAETLIPRVIHGRAEELGHDLCHREKYDVAIARAVTSLPVLAEYCLPFVKLEGLFIAMKGRDDETEEAKRAIGLLGGELEEIYRYELFEIDVPFTIIIIRKRTATLPRYPRRTAAIKRRPL